MNRLSARRRALGAAVAVCALGAPAAALAPTASGPAGCAVRTVFGERIHIASGAVALARGAGSVWVAGYGVVSRLDASGDRLAATVATPGSGDMSQLAVGAGSVWVTAPARESVYRIDPRSDRVIATIAAGGPAVGVAVGGGRVWVTVPLGDRGRLIAIDPRDDRRAGSPIAVGPGPGQVVDGLGHVWVQDTSPSAVVRVRPDGREITVVPALAGGPSPGAPGPGTIATGDRTLWAAKNGSLIGVDPRSGRVRTRTAVPRGVALALGDGRVWVLASPRSSSPGVFDPIPNTAALWQVDPAHGAVLDEPLRLGLRQPIAIAIAAGRHALWIADYASSSVVRLRLVSGGGRVCRSRSVPARSPGEAAAHRRPPAPTYAALYPATGTWVVIRGGHLIVGRGHTRLWRSRGPIAAGRLGVVMASSRMVAFQYGHRLYLARRGGPERAVGSRELPLAWARDGIDTYSYPGRRLLLLRSDTGAVVSTIARAPFRTTFVVAGGRLYFVLRGVLMSVRGTHARRLASVSRLGLAASGLAPAGRMVELRDDRRLAVVRPDGTVFASVSIPRYHGIAGNISSALIEAPGGQAVAFTVAYGQSNDPGAVRLAHGVEVTYLLAPGTRFAIPVHTERVAFRVCERGADLRWRGHRLLYSNSEGDRATIDVPRAA